MSLRNARSNPYSQAVPGTSSGQRVRPSRSRRSSTAFFEKGIENGSKAIRYCPKFSLSCSSVHDANATTADQFFDVIDEETISGNCDSVGLKHSAELAWLFEIEQQLAASRSRHQDGVQLFEQRNVGAVEWDLDT